MEFSFRSPRLVTIPSLNSLFCPTVHAQVKDNIWIHSFPKGISKIKTVSSRVWIRITLSSSYDDNNYPTSSSLYIYIYITSDKVHLPWKQRLVNRKWHQQATSKGTAIDRLSVIWKSDLTDKGKRSFLQATAVSILDALLRAVLNKSWSQHTTKQAVQLPSTHHENNQR